MSGDYFTNQIISANYNLIVSPPDTQIIQWQDPRTIEPSLDLLTWPNYADTAPFPGNMLNKSASYRMHA